MPGPLPKPDERRQGRHRGDGIGVLIRGDKIVRVPDHPDYWNAETVEWWEAFWSSGVAQAVDVDSELPMLRRLFGLYDERERAAAAYRKQRMVEGSQGQLVMNPMGRMMQSLDKEIRNLEDRAGMNPKAKVALGIQIQEARKGLNQLMEGLTPDYGDSDEEAAEADIREA